MLHLLLGFAVLAAANSSQLLFGYFLLYSVSKLLYLEDFGRVCCVVIQGFISATKVCKFSDARHLLSMKLWLFNWICGLT